MPIPGDGAFIDRCTPFNNFTIAGDNIASFYQYDIAFTKLVGRNFVRRSAIFRLTQLAGKGSFFTPFRLLACALLRPSASASAKLANSTVIHSQPLPTALNSALPASHRLPSRC